VKREWRGQGIGTALAAELIKVVARISLSPDSRYPATRLYERLGLEPVSRDDTSVAMLHRA
jgi:GNAT superfamily N-acetyltransferase